MKTNIEHIEQEEVNQANNPWYAIRTFNCQEQKVSNFLTDNKCINFIPMMVTLSKVKDNETSFNTSHT